MRISTVAGNRGAKKEEIPFFDWDFRSSAGFPSLCSKQDSHFTGIWLGKVGESRWTRKSCQIPVILDLSLPPWCPKRYGPVTGGLTIVLIYVSRPIVGIDVLFIRFIHRRYTPYLADFVCRRL